MKTSIILSSSDRELFGITIKQKTENQFLSVTDLQKAYEVARWENGWSERRIESVMQTQDFKERVYYILEQQGFIKTTILAFMELVENDGIAKTLKELSVWKTTGKGSEKAVFCNPYIWVLLAMELNPMIYAKVIIWLTDSLVFNRLEAGSEYLPMNQAIKSVIENPDYVKYAKAINERVFGQHITGMRQLASAKELRKITDIELFIKNAISNNWVKTEEEILKAIKNYN
jgi:hypothetical protein